MTSNLVTRIIVIIIVMALAALCISLNWPVKLGIDLRGGSILTYEVQELQQGSDGPTVDEQGFDVSDVDETIAVISQRINAQGLADIQVRRAGDSYIELVLPDVSKEETDDIRQKMTQVGQLLFPIAAQAGDKAGTTVFNEQQFNQAREAALRAKRPYQAPEGFGWFPIRPERGEKEPAEDYAKRIEKYENDRRTNLLEVNGAWMYFDPDFWDPSIGAEGITGKMIKDVRRDTDQNGGRSVTYKVEEADQANFAVYTDRYTNRSMAVVLNGEIWSQANINGALKDNVQIYKGGGGYTESEQSWLINCLKSGSLKLKPELVSQDEIAATLGKKAIDRGLLAFIIGLIAVIGMMFVYYRTSGMFAVLALMVNFMLIFGVLMVLEASLTLPGIAGLILTVGMAVDANILIFERIREELSKGKTVIQSAKNGFDRAFVTIFDANLTTFIVAAFLVYFGQGPIKGFGYTLMVGIICSMFSALYITRTLMGLAIKKGWMESIKYGQILSNPKINFQAMFKKAAVLSVALVIIGLGIFFAAGDRKYGLDFTGGTSLRMNFNEPISEQEIKDAVAKIKNAEGKQKYQKIEIAMISPSGGKSTEVKLDLDYVRPEKVDDSAEGKDEFNAIEGEILAQLGDRLAAKSLQAENFDANTGTWTATLNLLSKAEQTDILGALELAGYSNPRATAGPEGKIWQLAGQVNADSEGQAARSLVEKLRKNGVDFSRPFEGTRFVGPRVVADLATSAISAMVASLFFILAYIWFRFQELKFGFAAAVALVHDVSIALGLTVLANMTGIIHVPITLNVIAAFLTIIGYSLNDTIVVFDRIRENRDNMRGSFGDVVNRSVNQTLSRTILTSITTAFVVLAVLVCNLGIESPLEGFAFTLLIGVIVGTYSSVFVASPLLIWAHNRESETKATAPAATARS